jgi:hypothetical protein
MKERLKVKVTRLINTKISRQQANGRIYFSEEKYMKRSRAAMKLKNQIQAYERKAKGKSYEAEGEGVKDLRGWK